MVVTVSSTVADSRVGNRPQSPPHEQLITAQDGSWRHWARYQSALILLAMTHLWVDQPGTRCRERAWPWKLLPRRACQLQRRYGRVARTPIFSFHCCRVSSAQRPVAQVSNSPGPSISA